MKTAISLPDELFEELERLVSESGRSRSELYAVALREFVARHAPERVTEALDHLADEIEQDEGERSTHAFVGRAARHTFERNKW